MVIYLNMRIKDWFKIIKKYFVEFNVDRKLFKA